MNSPVGSVYVTQLVFILSLYTLLKETTYNQLGKEVMRGVAVSIGAELSKILVRAGGPRALFEEGRSIYFV